VGEKMNAYRVLVGKPEGKIPLGIHRNRWKDNIKMNLKKQDWVAWTGFVWLRKGTSGGLLWT
jgi:hypothetical protein